ncbi:WAT1-related protein At5g07050-like [Ricinus communis]|uniref:WAT1-related protein At5g07050-like n=1 Tax=Ricinus communis TaxID=3988 RepID=UPI000D69060F|nr:WAT1-related protein At5g07050-like [Ricinus communis]|eukprot:XP_025012008.1 WAT1-related protein At5g07050-like [Ricinus communis]
MEETKDATRNENRISRVIWISIFFLGLLQTLGRVTFFAAFTGAMINLVPSMTFILAILFRMEKLDIAKMSSQAQIGGTAVAFGGATIMTLYKGIITVVSFHNHHHAHHQLPKSEVLPGKDYLKGSLILVVHCLPHCSICHLTVNWANI